MNHSKSPLFEIHNTEITYLKGVGPKRGAALKKNGINSIGDLIRHYPRRYLDRTNVKLIKDDGANIFDLIKYKNIIITSSSLKKIQERVLNEKN